MLDPRDSRSADVFHGSKRVGSIERTSEGSVFRYEGSVGSDAGGIAFQLPYDKRDFSVKGVNLHPFFANMLPEGLRLQALARKVKTSPDDLLTLLMSVGTDVIGDVFVSPQGAKPKDPDTLPPPLSEIDFQAIRTSLLASALHEEAVSGVQAKISAERILRSVRTARSGKSYLLKLADPNLPHLVENEHVCMQLARKCGLQAAATKLVTDKNGVSALLVERFDRPVGGDSVHFEDLCQLLDRYPADKYLISAEEAIASLQQVCTSPPVAALHFVTYYAFSYMVGNGDLHAKNVGIVGAPAGALVNLAPAYDVLTTLPYDLDQGRAMPFEGGRGKFRRKDLRGMAALAHLPERAVTLQVDRVARNLMKNLDLMDRVGFGLGATTNVKTEIRRRILRLSED